METDIQQMEERYQHLMEILNITRQEISYQESLMNSPELVKSLDSASSESDETLKATWKKIFKNEKNLQKVLSSQKELEEKLQKQIQALDRQKELRDGDKLETRKILDDIKNVMLNSNKLELSVERSQHGLEQITAMQEETSNNLTRLADRLDTFKVNTDQVEENLKNMMLSHQEAQLANEREWSKKFKQDTKLKIEDEVQSLMEIVSQLSSQFDDQVNECSAKLEQKLQSISEDKSKLQVDVQELDRKLDGLDKSIQRLLENQEASETVVDLESRVKDLNLKLNQFVQNVLAVKTLPQIVDNLKKRLKSIENSFKEANL